uniref:Uncharacterized protein n=1 Tax=Pseudo-nitzschia delicatissima TaxID=44447 RepID=A0A7S0ULM4_9STRA|mmetsp:Transcript_62/g.141  ORF Transcript_62/g.141 Transcript_62/m.141 type:complete len:477 (+) Transcript_62:67-1497(+)
MKSTMTRTLQFALLASCSTLLVNAFHLQPFRSGTTPRVTTGHQQYPKIVTIHDKRDDITIGSQRSPQLFAAGFDRNLENNKNGRIRRRFERISSYLLRLANRLSFRTRTLVVTFALFCMINLSVMPAWAGTNGRMGGSFGRSDRFRSPAITRTIRPSNPAGTSRTLAPKYRTIRAPIRNYNRSYRNYHSASGEQAQGEGVAILSNSDGSTTVVRKVNTHPYATSKYSASDVVLVSGVTAVVANGVIKGRANRDKYDNDDTSEYPLGPGISVWRLTACLNVPNTNDPSSIVRRLQKLAETTSTETRKGLQTILADTSLELLRQLEKGSVASVEAQYDHYRSSDEAEVRAQRQFSRISTKQRSKFEKESLSSYNGRVVRDDSEEEGRVEGTSSLALVQIHIVIEGNMMKPFGVRQTETKKSLQDALLQLSGDLNAVEDCVLSGEVLWSPQQLEQNEVLTEEDIYASHPMLWPVDYSTM